MKGHAMRNCQKLLGHMLSVTALALSSGVVDAQTVTATALINGTSIIQASDGNYWIVGSGTNDSSAIIKLYPDGSQATVFDFGTLPNGPVIASDLIEGQDGNFYGIEGTYGGPLFKLSPSGVLTTYSNGVTYEAAPFFQGPNGNFYLASSTGM